MIKPISLPSAAGIDYGKGDVRHFAQGDAVDVPGLANPTRELAERDNKLAEKVNEVVQQVNNREQFIPLPVVRTMVAPGDETVVQNYRIPEGFEARVLNAAVSASPSSDDIELNVYYNTTFGNSTGSSIVTATAAAEFTGETSFHQAGELIISLKNTGVLTLEASACVLLTMRPLGAVGSLLVGTVVEGPQGPPGPKGDKGDPGPAGTGTAGTSGMLWRGLWNIGTAYNVNDTVRYQQISGVVSCYICLQNNTGFNPEDNPTQWDVVVEGGADGATGAIGDPGAQGDPGVSSGVPNYLTHFVYGTMLGGLDWSSGTEAGYGDIVLNAGDTDNEVAILESFVQSDTNNFGYSGSIYSLTGVLRFSFKGNGTFTLPKAAYGAGVDYDNSSIAMMISTNGTVPTSVMSGTEVVAGVSVLPVSTDKYVVKNHGDHYTNVQLLVVGFQTP